MYYYISSNARTQRSKYGVVGVSSSRQTALAGAVSDTERPKAHVHCIPMTLPLYYIPITTNLRKKQRLQTLAMNFLFDWIRMVFAMIVDMSLGNPRSGQVQP